MSPHSHSRLLLAATAGTAIAATASADVIPLLESEVLPGATVETFENIAGVDLDLEPFFGDIYIPRSIVPDGYMTLSGVTVHDEGTGSTPYVWDFAFNDPDETGVDFAWGLGNNGEITKDTPLPSGTAFFIYDNIRAQSDTFAFSFASPVAQIGAYIESVLTDSISNEVFLEAYDSDNNLLGSMSIFTDGVAQGDPLDSWIGLQTDDGSAMIASIRFSGVSVVVDDLTFAVPSPGALVTLAGAGLLYGRRRRPGTA